MLVHAWITADRDWRKVRLPPEDAEQLGRQLNKSMRAYFRVDGEGRLTTWIDDTMMLPFDVAIALFLRIASDVGAWRLCGPCPTCRKYFARMSKRPKKYCSRKCRRSESGPRMARGRELVRNKNISLARKGQEEYKQHHRRDEWKTWVANYVNARSVSPIEPKSLTRWIKSHLIDDLPLTVSHS